VKNKLDTFIDSVHHLPPSPRLLVKLLGVFNHPDKDIDEVVELISNDPSFTAEVLKRCNSAFFASGKPAEDIFDAVSRLGFREIYSIVLAMFAINAILRPEARGGSSVEMLWRHSIAVAVAAGELANQVGESNPAAFTAGLLHEVGKVVMLSGNKAKYTQAVQKAGDSRRSVVVTEKEIFGFDHTEVGARLLKRWHLPPNIIATVRHHHDLAGAEPFERLAAAVHLANVLAHATEEKLEGDLKALPGAKDSMAVLQLTPVDIRGLLPAMQVELKKARALTAVA
jgi:putative nucleotidyltransferase with HDIG domain